MKKRWQMKYWCKYTLVMFQMFNLVMMTLNIQDNSITIILKTFCSISMLMIHTLLAKHSDFFKEGIL